MNWKLKRIDLCGNDQIKPCEERDLLCIELEKETKACIHGVVRFPSGKPVEGAVVKLFKKADSNGNCHHNDKCHQKCDLIPITFTFTDECGQFLFGVCPKEDYVIKIFFFKPENCCPPPPCDGKDHHDSCDC